jgi:hypothetical protein
MPRLNLPRGALSCRVVARFQCTKRSQSCRNDPLSPALKRIAEQERGEILGWQCSHTYPGSFPFWLLLSLTSLTLPTHISLSHVTIGNTAVYTCRPFGEFLSPALDRNRFPSYSFFINVFAFLSIHSAMMLKHGFSIQLLQRSKKVACPAS